MLVIPHFLDQSSFVGFIDAQFILIVHPSHLVQFGALCTSFTVCLLWVFLNHVSCKRP